MIHPEFRKVLAADHVEQLRRDARVVRGPAKRPGADRLDVELRLCRIADESRPGCVRGTCKGTRDRCG